MTKKVMLINATDSEEIRVATLVDGLLSDFDIEFVHNEKIKGNIYKARVIRVDTSLQAAFVHYGGQKNGFLPIGELPRDLVSADGRRGRIQDLLNRDQEIMVQAVREEIGTKGAMMTAQISLPGRYLVLTPGNPLNGISRKIESREEREHFKRLIDELEIPKNFGVIVRTASLGVTKEDFQRDLEFLLDTYKEVQSRYKHRQGPGLVWQEDDVVTRTLRDGFSSDMEEVHIDDLDTFHAAQSFFKRTMPQFQSVLKHHTGKKPLFSKYQTDEQIDRIYARRVNLPSGGALVLDQTEALVAVDVNSGKTSGEGVEDMAFKTNMEAAEEVARQLRLRDLAGLIVIDFIDMKKDGHNRAVMERLVECLKEDKARMEVGKINSFGVLVMTRQRLRPSIHQVTHESCPTCQGTGQVKSMEALVLSVVRRLKSMLSRDGVAEVRLKLAPAVAMAVLNQKRKDLAELESAHDTRILVMADMDVNYGDMTAEIERREEESEKPAPAKAERMPDPDEETVVLGGDTPISFDKALGSKNGENGKAPKAPKEPKAEIKYDRRDAQRAALDERERLRALFESAKPLALANLEDGEAPAPEPEAAAAAEAPAEKPAGRGRGRGRGKAPAPEAKAPEVKAPEAETVQVKAPAPKAPVVPAAPPPPPAEPPAFDPSLVTNLRRPKLSAPVPAEAPAAPAPRPRGRPRKNPKAEAVVPEPPKVDDVLALAKRPVKAKSMAAPEPVPAVEAEPKAEAKPKRKPAARKPKS
ncbi:MAG: Rne/Rng family ribonuclease [Firmicutes bacterium]|nr:Rne/Rng family ribonuclease [Bacillota bacterium]